MTWQVTETDPQAREGAALMKKIVGTVGGGPDAPQIKLTLYTPANAKKPVPVILLVNFGGGPTPPATQGRGGAAFRPTRPLPPRSSAAAGATRRSAMQDIQPDRANASTRA